jgi:radical SAM protein (TIGR01212 family)
MKYLSANEFFKSRYGTKVYRLSLSSGCTCPNRDGTIGYGGCTFCSEGGSGDFAAHGQDIDEQIEEAKKWVDAKFSRKTAPEDRRYLAYFQSYTNTYGDVGRLTELYTHVLERPEIVGISIGTRPDCLGDDVMEMLEKLQKMKDVYVELGLQTSNDRTAERIHRGYPTAVFDEACRKLKDIGVNVIVHVILGLQGETEEDMLATVDHVVGLSPRPDGIKLQLLHVLKGTQLAEEYKTNPFHMFTLEEYCQIVGKCLQHLPDDMVVHRLTGDGPKKLLIAPMWSADKKRVLNTLNHYLANLV